MTMLPYIQSEIAKQWGYNPSTQRNTLQTLPDGLTVYPDSYFDPDRLTPDSYGRHLALGSWRETRQGRPRTDWRYRLERIVVAILSPMLRRLGYAVIKKN